MAVNVRKIFTPTSSDTSESQSVDDNNPGGSATNNRIAKNIKSMKDASNDKESDSKRPPWRAVSVSTLPKPDKNALLKAKLLDASRRLRTGKASIAIQTDIEPTKLMKEAVVGAQTDLVLYRDVSVMTDGSYAKRKQVSDEFILTYSVSQMTDGVSVQENSTQTLLPKVGADEFLCAYFNTNLTVNDMQKFTKIEQELLQQIKKIRDFKTQRGINTHTLKMENILKQDKDENKPFPLQSTFGSWHFDYETNPGTTPAYVLETMGRDHFKWPLPMRMGGGINYHHLKLFFLAIDDLIQESAKLVNTLEQLKLRTESRHVEVMQKMDKVIKSQAKPLVCPSTYWHAKIKEQEKELNKLLKSEKPFQVKSFDNLCSK